MQKWKRRIWPIEVMGWQIEVMGWHEMLARQWIEVKRRKMGRQSALLIKVGDEEDRQAPGLALHNCL